jgi:hypothetical protein
MANNAALLAPERYTILLQTTLLRLKQDGCVPFHAPKAAFSADAFIL